MQISNNFTTINTPNNINNTDIEHQDNNIRPLENSGFISRYLVRIYSNAINRRIDNNICRLLGSIAACIISCETKFLGDYYLYNKQLQSPLIADFLFFSSAIITVLIIIIRSSFYTGTKLYSRNIIGELTNINYKNLDKYQGNIEEFKNKLSVINLEEITSKSLKDPVVYDKQFYSFTAFKKAVLMNGKIPHNGLEIKPNDIKNIKRLEFPANNIKI